MTNPTRVLSRRHFVRRAILAGAAGVLGVQSRDEDTVTLPFANGTRPLARFPQKRPLIVQTTRPPQLETPFSVFNESVITPNDAFFVRYHFANIPTSIEPATFRLEIKGLVHRPLTYDIYVRRPGGIEAFLLE